MGERERKQEACEGKKQKTSLVVVYQWSGQGSYGFMRMGNTGAWGREFVWENGKLNA